MNFPLPLSYFLGGQIMNFAWGQSPEHSFILKFNHQSLPSSAPAQKNKPIAELWMGAHGSAPATISQTDQPVEGQSYYLDQEIRNNPQHFLGPELAKQGQEKRLPFLCKILDVARPLSIQAHPDNTLAPELHRRQPEHYPDPYHKPELAVCIENMRALVGFRPMQEIINGLQTVPSLADLCGQKPESLCTIRPNACEAWLKEIYARLMQASAKEVKAQARRHLDQLSHGRRSVQDELFVLFTECYGLADPGIFCSYLLNYVQLQSGQAIFLGPNEPHCYISGIILECMSASDNVVRAGLTNKYCDIPTLLSMLHYRMAKPDILHPLSQADDGSLLYPVPVNDFSLGVYDSGASNLGKMVSTDKSMGIRINMGGIGRPSILVVLQGQVEVHFYVGKQEKRQEFGQPKPEHSCYLKQGTSLFLPGDLGLRNIQVFLQFIGQGKVYRASCP